MMAINNLLKSIFLKRKTFPYNYYYIFKDLKLIYLAIPKNANSAFRSALFSSSKYTIDFKPNLESAVKYLSRTNNTSIKLRNIDVLNDKKYTKIVLIRNPMDRLVSAFLDKYIKKNLVPNNYSKYVDTFNNISDTKVDINSISFNDFIKIVELQNPLLMNPHWKPQSDFIGNVKFDHYVPIENMDKLNKIFHQKFNIDINKKMEYSKGKKITIYNDRVGNYINASQLKRHQLRKMISYPKSIDFYNSKIYQIFIKKYNRDIDLYINITGAKKDELLKEYFKMVDL